MSTLEFSAFPKIARLNRDITITEKIDGTNAAVVIVKLAGEAYDEYILENTDDDGNLYSAVAAWRNDTSREGTVIYAQSRTRFITPKQDNYGFAGWVQRNAEALVATLGEGTHFGEWWGAGIQRKYGLTGGNKRFSLFNTKRWGKPDAIASLVASGVPGLYVVPVLYEGPFDQGAINYALARLDAKGSAATDFDRPEGIVVFHHASRDMFKVTLEGDEAPKGAAAHAHDEERIAA